MSSDDGLHFRIGVTTGEVLVTVMPDGAVRATGDIVNTAARLQASAPTDSVLVDETTHRATTRAIVLESVEPIEAKGKSERVPAWLAVEPRSVVPEQTRLGGLASGGTRRRGRDASGSARSRPCASRSTQLVSIIGEPGIGKSRLIEDLSDYIGEHPRSDHVAALGDRCRTAKVSPSGRSARWSRARRESSSQTTPR